MISNLGEIGASMLTSQIEVVRKCCISKTNWNLSAELFYSDVLSIYYSTRCIAENDVNARAEFY